MLRSNKRATGAPLSFLAFSVDARPDRILGLIEEHQSRFGAGR
ncbi:hypothetical protein [Lolliginicoccus lacisalsi]|nr:hypothetical protein [Lolliginicoccus lacisalsi]